MEVSLLSYTPNPVKLIYIAARTCYSKNTPQILWKSETEVEKMRSLISRTIEAGHESILEHVSFTFAISGISRSCSHQLVRHRIASFSQQSQRYVKLNEAGMVIPKTFFRNEKLKKTYEKGLSDMQKIYDSLLSSGIPAEDARYVLLNATTTNLVMTMNYRELLHACGLRLCPHSQWEIRELFTRIKREIRKVEPFLADKLQPKCIPLGYCNEPETCGIRPKREDMSVLPEKIESEMSVGSE